VGPSYFKRSTLGKESFGEGVKLSELDCGGLGLSLLLDCGLSQLISLVLHLGNQDSTTGIHGSVESGNKDGDLPLSCGGVLLDLVEGAIQGGNGLPRLLLSLGVGDGVAGNLVLEWAGNLAQGTEGVARVLLAQAERANGVVAGLAIGVDFGANVGLAAGNPLHLYFPLKHIVNRDQLVRGGHFPLAVCMKTGGSHISATLGAVHRRILLLTASLTFHLVHVLHRRGKGSREGVDEHTSSEGLHSLVGGHAHLTSRLLI